MARFDLALGVVHALGRLDGAPVAVLALGEWLADRRREETFGGESVLMLGDFNLAATQATPWTNLAGAGLVEAPSLLGDPGSNLSANRRYDRILCGEEDVGRFTGRAGTVDVFAGSFAPLLPGVEMTENRMTWEVSDHLPLWAEMRVGS